MKKKERFSIFYFLTLLAIILSLQLMFFPDRSGSRKLIYNQFLHELDSGKIKRVVIMEEKIVGEYAQNQDTTDHTLTNAPTTPWRIHIPDIENQKRLAAQTPGFASAEIANVFNETGLLAVRNNRKTIIMADFKAAIERVIAGLEKKNKLINEKERKIVGSHESGHAIAGYFTEGADKVQKVSIVPPGIGALGYTHQVPLEDRYLMSYSELIGKIKGLLGGRAAEEIVFEEVSTGASNDLEKFYPTIY
jgi:ATP-dependent Zn protease